MNVSCIWLPFRCCVSFSEKFLVCPMKHAAVAMDIDGSHKLIPLDDDVSITSLTSLVSIKVNAWIQL